MFVKAGWFWRPVLKLLGGVAITMPWKRVYLLEDNVEIRSHEQVHLDQIARGGAVTWSVKYLWWLIRYGYLKNPYEIEAYKLEIKGDKT